MQGILRQRALLSVELVAELEDYLKGMRERARHRLMSHAYHFVKAYQYQYLTDVPQEFYDDFSRITEELANQRLQAAGDVVSYRKTLKSAVIPVLKSIYLEMAASMILNRQYRASATVNEYTCSLPHDLLGQLTQYGEFRSSL